MSDEEERSGLIGGVEKCEIVIADYDAGWPEKYRTHARRISASLGAAALRIEHIGSTSVPGLAAKPIIDILLVVADSADESCYLQKLTALGYELRVREPEFHEHRMFRTCDRDVHVHVLSIGSTEIDRYLTFRDRLRGNTGYRRRYEAEKRRLAARPWPDMNAYADAKTDCIERILAAGSEDEAGDGRIEP